MTVPPENLMDWPKKELVKELQRLRAVLHEHSARHGDNARSGGDAVTVDPDPHSQGTSLIDTHEAVLLESNEVILIDSKRPDELPGVALIMEGRVNLTNERVKQLYLMNSDGAAALVTQLIGLAGRAGEGFGRQFFADYERRMDELP